MNCRETLNLLPLFCDGELDGRQMRAVAMHSARCRSCEGELRQVEHLQELIAETVTARVEEADFSGVWKGIEQRLDAVPLPWWKRFEAWWADAGLPRAIPAPAFAAAVLIILFGFLLLARAPQVVAPPDEPLIASTDGGALIDSLATEYDAVAVITDPETGTTLLWVSDEEAEALEEGQQ